MKKGIILILALMVFMSAIGVVYSKYKNRKIFVALHTSQQVRDQLMIEFGQLKLEQSTWATHARIERIARDSLNMRVPVSNKKISDVVYMRVPSL